MVVVNGASSLLDVKWSPFDVVTRSHKYDLGWNDKRLKTAWEFITMDFTRKKLLTFLTLFNFNFVFKY